MTGRYKADHVHSVRNVRDEVVFQTAIIVVSVAKSYSNRGNHVHRQDTKKRWYLYFIDEDGKFKTRRINALEALYYRGKKTHRYRVVCPECSGLLLAFVKSLKGDYECPYRDFSIALDELDDEAIDALPEDDL
jgi:hypothetical protein